MKSKPEARHIDDYATVYKHWRGLFAPQKSRGHRWSKCDFASVADTSVKVSEWEPKDRRALVRLAQKYGKEAIRDALSKLLDGKPLRGRPPNPRKLFEEMHLADWIEDRIKEHRAAGHKDPVQQAYLDAFHMEHGRDDDHRDKGAPAVFTYIDTTKKKRLGGKRALRKYKSALKRSERQGNKSR